MIQKLVSSKYLPIVTGLIELTLTCHAIGAFTTLEYKLREQNYFSDQTDEQKDRTYSRLYTLMLIYNTVHKVIIGIIQDTCGMWIMRCIVHIEMITGLILLICCTPDNESLVFIAYPMFYGSTVGLALNFIQVTTLDPDRRGLWNACISPCITIAYQWYLWYRQMENPNKFFYLLLIFQIPVIARTFLFTAKGNTVKNGVGLKTFKDPFPFQIYKEIIKQNTSEQQEETVEHPIISKWKEILSLNLLFLWLNCIIQEFRVYTFIDQFQSWLIWSTNDNPDKIAFYTDFYLYVGLTAIILNPFFGLFLDKLINFLHTNPKFNFKKKYAGISACCAYFITANFCAAIISLCFSFKTTGVNVWIASLAFMMNLATWFVSNTVFIMHTVKPEQVSSTIAVKNTSGLSCFFIPLIIQFINGPCHGNFAIYQYIHMGFSLAAQFFPIAILVNCFRSASDGDLYNENVSDEVSNVNESYESNITYDDEK